MSAQSEQPAREARNAQILSSLNFLRSSQPLDAFMKVTNPERVSVFEAKRIAASAGIGYCMDERPPLHGTPSEPLTEPLAEASRPPKPAMVAGAAGWMMYFRLMGLDISHAADATAELYKRMNWGTMEVHNDDHHGDITDLDELKQAKTGCGALSVKDNAFDIVFRLLADEMDSIQKVADDSDGSTYIDEIVARGGKIIPLTKDHKTKDPDPSKNAAVVVNMQPGTTIDREAAYEETPCFVWDAGSTIGDDILLEFNKIADAQIELQSKKHHNSLTKRHFIQLQAAMHLAVGELLGATRLGHQGNIVVLQ